VRNERPPRAATASEARARGLPHAHGRGQATAAPSPQAFAYTTLAHAPPEPVRHAPCLSLWSEQHTTAAKRERRDTAQVRVRACAIRTLVTKPKIAIAMAIANSYSYECALANSAKGNA
jgi:hypothetical protein